MELDGAHLRRRRRSFDTKSMYFPTLGRRLSREMLSSRRGGSKRKFSTKFSRSSGDRGQRRQVRNLRRCPGSWGFR